MTSPSSQLPSREGLTGGVREPGYEQARLEAEAFAFSPALDELAGLYGVGQLPTTSGDRLAAMVELSARYWDFRKGAERGEIDWSDELLDQVGSYQWNTVFGAADKLGLIQDSKPKNTRPDSLVILGGQNRAPLDRFRYGLESVDGFGQIVYLGSSREVSVKEREKAADYAPGALTEFDLGCGAFELLLGAEIVDEVSIIRDGDVWGMRLYNFVYKGESRHGFALSTPQYIGADRASSYDNYRFFADRAELADDLSHSIVAVTTGIYTKGQHYPGVHELVLPYGAKLETIGHSAEYSGANRTPKQLLQETRAAITRAHRLHERLGL